MFAWLESNMGGGGAERLSEIGGFVAGIVICVLVRARRDSAGVSDAQGVFADTHDLTCFSDQELAELHKSDPGDLSVLLRWMNRCLTGNRMSSECLQAFTTAMPRIVAEQPLLDVAQCLSRLATATTVVASSMLVEVGERLERGGNPSTALGIYDVALRDTRLSPDDRTSALYRSAMIYETTLHDPSAARSLYEQVIQLQPMSMWADQSKARLIGLERKP